MVYIRLRKVKPKQIGGINGHSADVFWGSDYIGFYRSKDGVVEMNNMMNDLLLPISFALGVILAVVSIPISGSVLLRKEALIKHGVASYNQTTGKFICDICKE